MRELNFFKTLLEESRKQGLNMFMTLPSKTKFPAWECDLVESKAYHDCTVLKLSFRGFFKDLNKDTQRQEKEKLEHFFYHHIIPFENVTTYAVRLLSEKFLPREKGQLQIIQSEWTFLLREHSQGEPT